MSQSLPILDPCRPPIWARGGHAQTVLAHLLPSPKITALGLRAEIAVSGGDRLVLREYPGTTDVVVYLFHGLGGSTDADYMHRTATVAMAAGHTVCLVNHRGCGEGAGLAFEPYHSGRGEDLSDVIEWGRARFAGKRHLAIGFSLSGSALLCLLSGLRGTVLPDFAIAVNAPVDLGATAKHLTEGFNRVYDYRFVQRVRAQILERQASGHFDATARIARNLRLTDLDSLYTGPVGGFGDAEGYYRECSTHSHLHRIKVPTILLTAEDDPFIPFAAYREARLSPFVRLHAEKSGGHMGYLARPRVPAARWMDGRPPERWLDYALGEFMLHLLA